ncbi:type II toxin-antitoxin system HicB family antitoxin [Crocosphaera sp. UHCC 0190]|uniref:type II toxin-antitoxin system HicB family antitoxin n=1 Tax=unclassified Crocosphaera TaxID=2623705 RepID=UPI002B219B73|nr:MULTISPECIES: type II toxin-antitoxin system HicB family antitoxin [unclassified Crocosphaera]MEA5508924.1 type II toxin-antitoxin system HicB family antitoxin [Crocosphaera sp. UHCC 0190]MEA5534901.1 type II toxin-antitoxin system HicB family antitoxin [Crocosphaera sp. XPORK-15E]
MNRLEFPVEYSFDVETNSVIATVPDLNYISSFGKDFTEAEQNVIEAVLAYLEALKMDGLPIPSCPKKSTGTVLLIELVA